MVDGLTVDRGHQSTATTLLFRLQGLELISKSGTRFPPSKDGDFSFTQIAGMLAQLPFSLNFETYIWNPIPKTQTLNTNPYTINPKQSGAPTFRDICSAAGKQIIKTFSHENR